MSKQYKCGTVEAHFPKIVDIRISAQKTPPAIYLSGPLFNCVGLCQMSSVNLYTCAALRVYDLKSVAEYINLHALQPRITHRNID